MASKKSSNPFTRILFVSLGLIFLVLGIIGYVLPGLPGTIWLIISASFFVRSSDRLYNFVVRNRFFGPQVRNFLETGEMGTKPKTFALVSMWSFSILSLIFAPYGLIFKSVILILALSGTFYILSRPSPH
jgi:uncharacterized membrane protein YbaN (DUF454 family)